MPKTDKIDDALSIEESMGEILTLSLMEVVDKRTLFPKMSVKETSLKMLSLFLKANNPRNNKYSAEKYGERLRKFMGVCEFVIKLDEMGQKRCIVMIRKQ